MLEVLYKPADRRHAPGKKRVLTHLVVLHATAGTDSLEWLTVDPRSSVSCHSLVKKSGQIWRIVPPNEIAWHAGHSIYGRWGPGASSTVNNIALGLEVENLNDGRDPYPDAQVDAAAHEIAEWFVRYGWKPILAHWMIDTKGKTDPVEFPWGRFYWQLDNFVKDLDVPF